MKKLILLLLSLVVFGNVNPAFATTTYTKDWSLWNVLVCYRHTSDANGKVRTDRASNSPEDKAGCLNAVAPPALNHLGDGWERVNDIDVCYHTLKLGGYVLEKKELKNKIDCGGKPSHIRYLHENGQCFLYGTFEDGSSIKELIDDGRLECDPNYCDPKNPLHRSLLHGSWDILRGLKGHDLLTYP